MRKIFTLITLFIATTAVAQDKPQITNGDFEDWSGVTDKNHAPANWNSFETATGGYASMVSARQVEQSSDVRPGSEGKSSARIYAREVKFFGVVVANAQGNLTTGRINAGAMTATDAENHNFADISSDLYSEKLGQLPDSIVFWAKFNPDNDASKARVAAVVHDSYNYITYGTDELAAADAENASHAVAKATLNFETKRDADKNAQWVRYAVPFLTDGCTATSPDYIMVNVSTNSEPGAGSAADELFIDDIELVYNEEWSFADNLVVTINGISTEPIPSVITVKKQEDGNYTLSLRNFILTSVDGDMPIGNVTVTDVVGVEQADGSILLKQDQNIMLEAGDAEGVDMWMGPMICAEVGAIPVSVVAVMDEKLGAQIHIDLTNSPLMQAIDVTFGDATTGIECVGSVKADDKNAPAYNLQGIRVDASYKGIIIRNGKKLIQK